MDNALRHGSVIAGKYRLERVLARGGMGSVWAAHHLQLDAPVAIKFMNPALTAPDARTRFEREAKAAAQLRSPHVVQIIDHGVDKGMPYIVMELLEGEHLGDRLRRSRRLALRSTAEITVQVAKALRRAHEAGIVHRDLKPANIFLAQVDEDEIVKVLDFGIAKATRGAGIDVTRQGVVMGSPSYMSPEQAKGEKSVDHRSDLWSLGVIVFRALTGEMAFHGESNVDVMLKICKGPLPVPSEVAPHLPREIDSFMARALCREPRGRFQSAREMAGALVDIVLRAAGIEPQPTKESWPGLSALDVAQAVAPPPVQIASVRPNRSTLIVTGPEIDGPTIRDATKPRGQDDLGCQTMAGARVEVAQLVERGVKALRGGDTETARRLFGEARELDPSSRIVQHHLRHVDDVRR